MILKKEWNSKVLDSRVFRHTNMRDQLIYVPSFSLLMMIDSIDVDMQFSSVSTIVKMNHLTAKKKSTFSQYVFNSISMKQKDNNNILLFCFLLIIFFVTPLFFVLLDEQLFHRLGYLIHTRVYRTYGLVYQHRYLSVLSIVLKYDLFISRRQAGK